MTHTGRVRLVALAASVLLVAGCSLWRPKPKGPLAPLSTRELPALTDDQPDLDSLKVAIERTMPTYKKPEDAAVARRFLDILRATPDPAARRAAIAQAFRVVKVRDPLLLTAYYEPELRGKLHRDANYRFPIYGRPRDALDIDTSVLDSDCTCRRLTGRAKQGKVIPYPTRAQIDAGALAGHGLEVAWADDPIALFALHVQGSGRLRLPDGKVVGLRFAGTNGHRFRSPMLVMRERGLVDAGATMPELRRALHALPEDEQERVLATNERFTFFKIAPGDVVGSLGVPLTPGRSIASDPRLVPPGSIAYVATPSAHRFVVSQDTGGAVTGAHVDLFLGAGTDAEDRAGRTNEHGTLYLLQPR